MNPQEESSRSSEHSPHPETSQPEGPSHPEIESPAETPVPIKQSASPQKPQKLPETTNEPSEPPEPSEPDDSDSDTSEPSRPPPRPLMLTLPPPGPDPGPDPGLSRPAPSHPAMSGSSKLKIPKPGYYTGKGDDRTMEKLQAWADEITFYLMVTNITDNDQMIPFAFLYTKEDARTWMKSWITTTNPDGTLERIK